MSFVANLRKAANDTRTENGAVALSTTGSACLDLFGTIGALRKAEESRIHTLFAEAYREEPLTATKIAFYARDIREGLGERKTFRELLQYMAKMHPEALRQNLDLIGVYGRYDDLYCLIGTPLEEEMWTAMKKQFEEDRENLEQGNAISLLAKWIKTADASSEKTRKLGILTAQKLGYSVYDFKRLVRRMRKHINVVECLMSTGRWDEIRYSQVPSRAMMIYRQAFARHDEEGFNAFIARAVKGEETIHSATLYPYDIVEKILYQNEKSEVLEAQWKQLPNYVEAGTNAIVMADVSGSMINWGNGRPMAASVGLAIYFAERNTGAYHNLFMTFSRKPQVVELKGETLAQKIANVSMAEWEQNTNLEAAFEKVLHIAVVNHTPEEEMPQSIIVISDMEIDQCDSGEWTFYDQMACKYASYGYRIPNVVFWNVNSRHDVFHADRNRKGVQLCSGQSVNTFKQLMSCVNCTPEEMMRCVIDSERYESIKVG